MKIVGEKNNSFYNVVDLSPIQLVILREVSLKGDTDRYSILRDIGSPREKVLASLTNLVKLGLLLESGNPEYPVYSVNSPEFLHHLEQMTNRVKALIHECDSLLKNPE